MASESDVDYFRNLANPLHFDGSLPPILADDNTSQKSFSSSYTGRAATPPGREWQTESQFVPYDALEELNSPVREARPEQVHATPAALDPTPVDPLADDGSIASTVRAGDNQSVASHRSEAGARPTPSEHGSCYDAPRSARPMARDSAQATLRHKQMLLQEIQRHPGITQQFTLNDDVADMQMALNQVQQTQQISTSACMMKGGVIVGCAGLEKLAQRYGRGYVNLRGYTSFMEHELEKASYAEIFIQIHRKYFAHAEGMNPVLSLVLAILMSAVTFACGARGAADPAPAPGPSMAQPMNRVQGRTLRPPDADSDDDDDDDDDAALGSGPGAQPFIQGFVHTAAGPVLRSVMNNPGAMQSMMGALSGML